MFLAERLKVKREFRRMETTSLSPEKKKSCREVQEILNAELNLAILRSNQKLRRHLKTCSECAKVWADNLRIKEALQRAVKKEVAPERLHEKLEKKFLKKD